MLQMEPDVNFLGDIEVALNAQDTSEFSLPGMCARLRTIVKQFQVSSYKEVIKEEISRFLIRIN